MDFVEEADSSTTSLSLKQDVRITGQGPHVFRPPVSPRGEGEKTSDPRGKLCTYESQGEHDPSCWLSHKCHVIVFTYSGKPVYSRYGSEDLIAGFTGTLQAIVAKFSSNGLLDREDCLRSISSGNLRMEFLNMSPLILVCISKNIFASHATLRRLLSGIHSQLMFVLTEGVNATLLARPNFDVRSLLGGTKPLLGNLISWTNRDMLLATRECAVEPLPLPSEIRTRVLNVLQQNCPSSSLLTMLLAGHRLVATASGSDNQITLSANDIILLTNLVISSTSMRSTESWTPVCLPCLSAGAFVYAYVQYLSEDVAYVCVSLSPESSHFHAISHHAAAVKSMVCSKLFDGGSLAQIMSDWISKCPLTMQALGDIDGSIEKREAISRVKHCAIVLNQSRQLFSTCATFPPSDETPLKDIFRCYQQCIGLLGDGDDNPDSSSPSQQVAMTYKDSFVFVWLTSEFQLFITAPRGTDVSVITYVYQWLRENEQVLFIPNIGFNGISGTRINSRISSIW